MQKLLVGKYDDAFCLVQMIGEDKCKVISTSSWLEKHDGFNFMDADYDFYRYAKETTLKDDLLTDVYELQFGFALKHDNVTKQTSKYIQLRHNILNLDEHLIYITILPKGKAETSDNIQIVGMPYHTIKNAFENIIYYKKNGKLFDYEIAKDLTSTEMFQKYYEIEFQKKPTYQNKCMCCSLKNQYANNPAFTLDDLLVSNKQISELVHFVFPKTNYSDADVYHHFGKNWHVFNEVKYYALHHEFVPDFYAYKPFGISAETLANSTHQAVTNAFIDMGTLGNGKNDTLNVLLNVINHDAGKFEFQPQIRQMLKDTETKKPMAKKITASFNLADEVKNIDAKTVKTYIQKSRDVSADEANDYYDALAKDSRILNEFKYYIKNTKFVPAKYAYTIHGYTAEKIYNITRKPNVTHLSILGVFNYMFYLMHKPAQAIQDLQNGLPIK